jgi:uncharacterized protein YndB with AHSA1/START domain
MKSTDINTRTEITKDLKDKSILVSREFDAPIEKVWRAFTDSEILDKWTNCTGKALPPPFRSRSWSVRGVRC